MQQRVQVVEANASVPPPIPNEPPPSSGTVLLAGLLSFIYHMLPALLGIIFILWRANAFLVKVFHLPSAVGGWPHVMSMMFGTISAQRPCYACHTTHGSATQPSLIVTGRSPGLNGYTQTATGGTCSPTWHGQESYRVNYGR